MYGNTHIFESMEALYEALENHWRLIAKHAIDDHGAFFVALAGGSTPRKFYERLAKQDQISNHEWKKTHIYFGDERCVPQGHEDSNYRMVKESLLSKVALLPEHVHAMFSADMSMKDNVENYNLLLNGELPLDGQGHPVFDLVMLGMGEDGHTASLFPGTEILNVSESPVASQFVKKLDSWRMSLTFPSINAARHVAIIVAGEGKAEILSAVFSEVESGEEFYPIQKVRPAGQLDWYLDVAAARQLLDREKGQSKS